MPTIRSIRAGIRKNRSTQRWIGCLCALWLLTGCQLIRGALSTSADDSPAPKPVQADRSALREVAPEAYALYLDAMLHMYRQQWAEAANALKKVTELDPNAERALQRLAICYLRMGKKDAMFQQLAKLSKLHKGDFATHYDIGRLYENEGIRKEAIREYEAARQLYDAKNPKFKAAMTLMLQRLARLYAAEKKTGEAVKCYEQILHVHPSADKSAVYFSIGLLNYYDDRWGAAAKAFMNAVKEKPDHGDAHRYLAFCYGELKDYERAIVEAKKCLEVSKDPKDQWIMRRVLSDYYDRTKQRDLAKKMRLEAIKILEKRIAQGTQHQSEYLALGELYRQEKRMEDSLEIARKALRLPATGDTLARDVHLLMAETYYDMNQDKETEQALRRALEFDPDYAMTNNFLGYFYAERGIHLDEAERLIKKALKAEPDNGAYLDSLGWTWYQQGAREGDEKKIRKALEKLLEAVKKMPDPVIREHIGDVYHNLGELDKAEHEWRKSILLWEEQPNEPPGPEGVKKKLEDLLKLKTTTSARSESGR